VSFDHEVARLAGAVECSDAQTQRAGGGLGRLFSCVAGPAQTAKLFVNGEATGSAVKNIKVMWNDWQKDRGYGLHADREEAENLVSTVAGLYVPEAADEIVEAFLDGRELEATGKHFSATVTQTMGPAILEHLLVIRTMQSAQAESEARIASADLFALCKQAVVSDLQYAGPISGDGDAVRESGYQSFFLRGPNRDQFWCEVYPDGSYRIKAAFKASYPFKYVASGRF
jgi:hypothetical protein